MGRADLRDGACAPQPPVQPVPALAGGKRIICLDIPDDYAFMQPALVEMLERKVAPFLR